MNWIIRLLLCSWLGHDWFNGGEHCRDCWKKRPDGWKPGGLGLALSAEQSQFFTSTNTPPPQPLTVETVQATIKKMRAEYDQPMEPIMRAATPADIKNIPPWKPAELDAMRRYL